MLDVVCKDLGITYPEVLKLRREFVLWHFYNAIERRTKEYEEKEQEKRFWIALMNPEAYQEIERKENMPLTEAETFEDVEPTDLKKLDKLAKERLQNSTVITEKPFEEEKSIDTYNPVSWE